MLTSYKIVAIKYGPERPRINLKSHFVDNIASDKEKLSCLKLMGHEFKAKRDGFVLFLLFLAQLTIRSMILWQQMDSFHFQVDIEILK